MLSHSLRGRAAPNVEVPLSPIATATFVAACKLVQEDRKLWPKAIENLTGLQGIPFRKSGRAIGNTESKDARRLFQEFSDALLADWSAVPATAFGLTKVSEGYFLERHQKLDTAVFAGFLVQVAFAVNAVPKERPEFYHKVIWKTGAAASELTLDARKVSRKFWQPVVYDRLQLKAAKIVPAQTDAAHALDDVSFTFREPGTK